MKLPSLLALLFWTGAALAQPLPPTSRTVYKCESGGKIHYSDAPCLGARKVDVEPTRGLNKSSGQERQGADVRQEHLREGFAEAFKPLTGLNAKQLDQLGRRQKLSPDAQRQCQKLDPQVLAAEAAEKSARTAAKLKSAQQRLFELRTAYRRLGCD